METIVHSIGIIQEIETKIIEEGTIQDLEETEAIQDLGIVQEIEVKIPKDKEETRIDTKESTKKYYNKEDKKYYNERGFKKGSRNVDWKQYL